MFYEAREKVIKLFDDHSTIASEAKIKATHENDSQNTDPQINASTLPITLAKVKGHTL